MVGREGWVRVASAALFYIRLTRLTNVLASSVAINTLLVQNNFNSWILFRFRLCEK